jgi:hypothetical protein
MRSSPKETHYLDSPSCPYSPECVELEFSEVHLQHYA